MGIIGYFFPSDKGELRSAILRLKSKIASRRGDISNRKGRSKADEAYKAEKRREIADLKAQINKYEAKLRKLRG